MQKVIDSHIHLDHYQDEQIEEMMKDCQNIEALITVSFHLSSSMKNLELSNRYDRVNPAFGFHPEQELPSQEELNILMKWMDEHIDEMVAVGEVGLPYYLREKKTQTNFPLNEYMELLEQFIIFAKEAQKPVILHAVYDDAPLVCDLLEKHSIEKAHFHWFKGDSKTIERMIHNRYMVSITPDVLYEKEIQHLVEVYPLDLMMVETDGPWGFEGPFSGKMAHPNMMHETIRMISKLKKSPLEFVYRQLLQNTKAFYNV